jgi:hypothetical protein
MSCAPHANSWQILLHMNPLQHLYCKMSVFCKHQTFSCYQIMKCRVGNCFQTLHREGGQHRLIHLLRAISDSSRLAGRS